MILNLFFSYCLLMLNSKRRFSNPAFQNASSNPNWYWNPPKNPFQTWKGPFSGLSTLKRPIMHRWSTNLVWHQILQHLLGRIVDLLPFLMLLPIRYHISSILIDIQTFQCTKICLMGEKLNLQTTFCFGDICKEIWLIWVEIYIYLLHTIQDWFLSNHINILTYVG